MPKVSIYDTQFAINRGELPWQEGKEGNPHWENFRDAMRFLGSIGFYVGEDKEIKQLYPILNDSHRAGRYANLKFKAEWHQNIFYIRFYQDVQHENPNGRTAGLSPAVAAAAKGGRTGYYDFEKLKKMPYLIRKQYELTESKLIDYFTGKGFPVDYQENRMHGKAYIINDYIRSCHHPQKVWFKLEEVDGQTPEYERDAKDRDGEILRNGEVKYFRDWGGYLCRGVVYHNINNMWWVLLSCGDVKNKACFDLFDLTNAEPRKRVKKHRPPEKYVERKKQPCGRQSRLLANSGIAAIRLSLCSTRELENELKRRKKHEAEHIGRM